jgi:hypothetical protein
MDGTEGFRDKMGALAALLVVSCVVIFGLYSWTHPLPQIGLRYADGVYRNDKCGTVTLKKGAAIFGNGNVAYNIERRKNDIAIITPHLLGVMTDRSGCHVVYDETRFSQYLTLGRADPPTTITLPGINDGFDYNFLRQ